MMTLALAHTDTHKRQPVTLKPARGPGGVGDLRTQNCGISQPGGGEFYSSPSTLAQAERVYLADLSRSVSP